MSLSQAISIQVFSACLLLEAPLQKAGSIS